jgi:hypothetical protein
MQTSIVVNFQTLFTYDEIATLREVVKTATQLPVLTRYQRDVATRFIDDLDNARQHELPFNF